MMNASNTPPHTSLPGWIPGYGIGAFFFILAGWFLWGPDLEAIPTAPTPEFHQSRIAKASRRVPLSDPPIIHIAGYDRTCMECHRIYSGEGQPKPRRLQHADIQLNHGPNVRCDTCHAKQDRNSLALQDGAALAFSDVALLCGQCHAKKKNDWDVGIHGKTHDYWDSTAGEVRHLVCTACHDPHRPSHPAMTPIAPLPGPHTLRMGKAPHVGHEGDSEENPLRRALNRALKSKTTGADHNSNGEKK